MGQHPLPLCRTPTFSNAQSDAARGAFDLPNIKFVLLPVHFFSDVFQYRPKILALLFVH